MSKTNNTNIPTLTPEDVGGDITHSKMKRNEESPVLGYKYCTHCGKLLPYEKFHRAGNTDDGLRYICKDCEKNLGLKGDRSSVRLCRSCSRILPLSSFRKNRSRKDGYHPECKECCRRRQKEYYSSIRREVGAIYKSKSGRYLQFDGEKSVLYWTESMIDELKKIQCGKTIESVSASLGLGRSAVREKAKKLGIRPPVKKTSDLDVVQYIKCNYSFTSNKELAKVLGLTERQIIGVARREHLRKSKEHQQEVWMKNIKHLHESNRGVERSRKHISVDNTTITRPPIFSLEKRPEYPWIYLYLTEDT